MKFRTEIPVIQHRHNLIGYNSKILLLGSCFVENVGDKLEYFKFQNTINPFGILFHPKAIETLISNTISDKEYSEEDIFFHNERWHCFDAHSKLSNASKDRLLLQLNRGLDLMTKQLNTATHVIITLGTAWVYNHIESNKIVANCHKIQQKQFKKTILSVDVIVELLQRVAALIKSVNKKALIIFTISPVRHLKDGFVQNQQSKSHLIAAIHQLLNQQSSINNCQSVYFPSYEIMMDELRDYRFYAEDLLHPSTTAINYIWEKFQQVWISSEALMTMEEVGTIQKGLQHKPFNPDSHKQFLQNLENKKAQLLSKFSHIVF